MFGGPLENVVIEFERSLIGAVYDRFGEGTRMTATSGEKCIASVKIQISPVFWGWLFQFAGDMKIVSPPHLVQECKKIVSTMFE